MGRKGRLENSAQTSGTRFQTPDKAATSARLSTNTSKPSQKTIASKGRNQIPKIPSLARSGSPLKRGSLTRSFGQPTLTQIDWVATKPQELDSDDGGLDYIDTEADGAHDGAPNDNARREVIEIPDDSGSDADYRPTPSSRTRQARGLGTKETATSKQRKSSATPQNESAGKGSSRRKSGGSINGSKKTNKQPPRERDKTLTQMDYVRRYLKVEPDEDVRLEYTYYSPKKDSDPESREAHRRSAQEALQSTKHDQMELSAHKRRRLMEEFDTRDPPRNKDIQHPEGELPRAFATPKKSVKAEIPSSQSPESPGFAVISPSRFRGMNLSSLKGRSPDTTGRPIKKEPSRYSQRAENLRGPDHALLPESLLPSSPTSYEPEELRPRNDVSTSKAEDDTSVKPNKKSTSTQRTVVYETDAESNSSDFQEDRSDVSATEKEEDDDNSIEDTQYPPRGDSQELPPPVIASDLDNEPGQTCPEVTLSSEASVCYRRPQQSTQFPLGPIPPLSTQRMAELFPQEKESIGQQIMTNTTQTQSSPAVQRRPLPIHPLQTQAQMQSQSQSQSQGLDKNSTEIVPESSPVTRQDNGMDAHESRAQEPVVQVQSSQPPDRLIMNSRMDQDSGPRGFISGNQLLSSSVMESIPMPQMWTGSQDTVGEPYSEPDKE